VGRKMNLYFLNLIQDSGKRDREKMKFFCKNKYTFHNIKLNEHFKVERNQDNSKSFTRIKSRKGKRYLGININHNYIYAYYHNCESKASYENYYVDLEFEEQILLLKSTLFFSKGTNFNHRCILDYEMLNS
jgi:hypothetical protein